MTTDAQPEPADQPANPRAKRPLVSVRPAGDVRVGDGHWCAAGRRAAMDCTAQRQRAAVQMVERLGGKVHYGDPPTNESRLTTRLRDWLPRDYFDSVEGVSFFYTPATDSDLAQLDGLTKLRWLWLSNTQVTDACFSRLGRQTKLQRLYLSGTQITDIGLAQFRGMAELEELYLGHTRITDAGVLHLTRHAQLQRLNLDGTQVTDDGVRQLQSELPHCEIIR